MLAMDVAVGVPYVNLSKLHEEIHATAIGLPEFWLMRLSFTNIAVKQGPTVIIFGSLHREQKGPMSGRHIATHLLQIHGQRIRSVGDAETSIEAGYD